MGRLTERQAEAETRAAAFHAQYGEVLEAHREAIEGAMNLAIVRFQGAMAEHSGSTPLCVDLAARTGEYVAWMRWALGDLPYYAIALGFDHTALPAALGPCILVYFSGRVLDDFLDRHYLYRGRRYTLLSSLTEHAPGEADADALTVFMALLLLLESLLQLGAESPVAARQLQQVLASYRGALLGALMDRAGPENWSAAFYERLIARKNVDYWMVLYDALDPEHRSPLCAVLQGYHALAQKVNDLQDCARDEVQGSANIVAVYRKILSQEAGGDGERKGVQARVEENIAAQLLELWEQSDGLPEPARAVVSLKLAETCGQLRRLGFLQAAADAEDGPEIEATPGRLGLAWYSELADFVQRVGVEALETVGCPVCGAGEGRRVFRKQGFAFQRCGACTHLYVSPRLRPDLVAQLASESAESDHDPFLQSQRIDAEFICRTLRRHSFGQRLLDVGHGEGYLMLAARALGFQAYGVEFGSALRKGLGKELGKGPGTGLREQFADRLQRCDAEREALPWGSFDFVVMSHVLEHVADPVAALGQVREALNPDGLVYLAVPDSESLQFKLLGRNWEAVTPVAHPQFFNETSLREVLRRGGFEPIERVPAPQGQTAERWMGLFRQLGGDGAGELVIVARRSPVVAL